MVTWLRAFAPAVMVAAIAVRNTERRLVEALELAGAVTPENAVKLPLDNFFKKWIFRRLLTQDAAGETMMQLQYLKVQGYAAYRGRRRKRALVAVAIIVALGVYAYLRRTNAVP